MVKAKNNDLIIKFLIKKHELNLYKWCKFHQIFVQITKAKGK